MSFETKIKLTGADKFILALENYNKQDGNSGNTCHYLLQLEGKITKEEVSAALTKSNVARWLASLKLSGSSSNYWQTTEQNEISVDELISDELFPNAILNITQNLTSTSLFFFHVLHRANGTSAILFSWHHLLMDGYGAMLFLSAIENKMKTPPPKEDSISSNSFVKARKAKRYITNSSKGPTAGIISTHSNSLKQAYKVLKYSKDDCTKIKANAIKHGAKFGLGNFYLASACTAVQSVIKSDKDYWFPIPQDTRKRGAKWPIVGNHLSFLFYRITIKDKSLKEIINSLNEQMLEQIRLGIPHNYSQLMNYLKHVPSGIYAKLIKGNNRSNVASFLFTTAPDHPSSLNNFMGHKVVDAYSIPPNTFPPGVTFVVNNYKKEMRIIILYYEHLLTTDQVDELSVTLSDTLLDN